MRKPTRAQARCEPMERRTLLSADVTSYGVYPLVPTAGLTDVQNVSPATADGTVFFTAVQGSVPTLWRTDGTPEGTAAVGPLPAAFVTPAVPFRSIVTFGDRLFASAAAADGFLVSDGSTVTAVPVPVAPTVAVAVGDGVFFDGEANVTAGGTTTVQHGLYHTDGTAAGTVELLAQAPLDLVAAAGRAYFFTVDTHGLHWWTSDGTAAGTAMLTTVVSATAAPPAAEVATYGASAFFEVPNGSYSESDELGDLWSTSGSAATTRRLASDLYLPFRIDGTDAGRLYAPHGRPVFLGSLFQAFDPATGTDSLLLDGQPGLDPGNVPVAGIEGNGDLLLQVNFTTSDVSADAATWWTTDGTSAGTGPVGPVASAPADHELAGPFGETTDEVVADVTPFVTGLAMAVGETDLDGVTPYGSNVLFYADGDRPFARTLAWQNSGTHLTAIAGLSVAAHGLVVAAVADDTAAGASMWAVGSDGMAVAAAADSTAPTVVMTPTTATDGTFTVTATDPAGFDPLPAVTVYVEQTNAADDDSGSDTGSSGSLQLGSVTATTTTTTTGTTIVARPAGSVEVGVSVVSAAVSDGGRTVVTTYQAAVVPGGVYSVSVLPGEIVDLAGNAVEYQVLGSLSGPAAVAPTPTPTPTPSPTPTTPSPTLTPVPVGGVTPDPSAGSLSLVTAAAQMAGTDGTARVTVSAAELSAGHRHVQLIVAATGGVPQATDAVVGQVTARGRKAWSGKVVFALPAGLTAGAYELVEVIAGSPGVYVDGPALAVSAATVDVAVAAVGAPPAGHPGGSVTVRLRLTNGGDVAADGSVTVTATAGTGGPNIGSAVRRVHLKPGASMVLAVHVVAQTTSPIVLTLTPDASWGDSDVDDKVVTLAAG